VMWFQPIRDLRDNEIYHYEALVRMYTQDGKILFPVLFIDAAETLGLIPVIDHIVIDKTMKFLSNLNKRGLFPSFSINLSGKELSDEGLLEYLTLKLSEMQVDPKHLVFEITETSAIRESDKAREFIKNLRAIGCGISLDDFGVGFTSFKYLKELEVDYIKIDGLFIKDLHKNHNDRLFVKAIADVAKGMKIKTIAEFVEHEETLKILQEYGVDYAQGYFIGKPSSDII
jgi:EAL domain-containing protein (putative c-di-GMP-specific phosphodiesterase class I)